jgi:hypothetical protein
MRRFDFPLERVRRWRLEQLNLEHLKLQKMLAERQALADAKQQVRNDLARTEQGILSQPSIGGLELENLDSYRLHIRARVRDFENREREFEAKVAEQRARVVESRRLFELLDQLRAKALATWHKAADREQEALAGELFLAKSTRNVSRSR